MSLYHKLRPQSLNGLFGNKETVKSLKKLLKMDNRPHTYLFTGERGTGKTTTARILVKELGCSDIDLEEMNGSDNRGIDDARHAIMLAHTSPIGGKCRVIIYDECHRCTRECQDALLKVLEDTPKTTYFILCSTNPEKILKTVRSRCTTYHFELLSEELMQEFLESTLENLDRDLDDTVFFGLIDCTEGSPRDALVLLEQILLLDNKDEQIKLLKKTQIEHEGIEICRLLLRGGNWKSIVEIYKGIQGTDAETIRRLIIGYMKVVMLKETDKKRLNRAYNVIRILEKNTFDGGEALLLRMLYECSELYESCYRR